MIRLHLAGIAVLAVSISSSTESLAQARGPSAKEIQDEGQEIESILETRRQEWERDWGQEAKTLERDEMRRDAALSASRLAEADAFLRRLTGRFRIEGRIERMARLNIDTGLGGQAKYVHIEPTLRSAKVAGVADCTAIGDGAGVNCLISASWPAFDQNSGEVFCRKNEKRPGYCEQFLGWFSMAETLDTMRPALLVLGLDTDPPQLRGMLVTADTLTNEWAGKLEGNDARLLQTQFCTALRCYVELGIKAEPGSDIVTITLLQRLVWGVTLTLTMHRDPAAQLEEELKPLRAR